MVGICFFFESYDVDVWSGRRIDLDAWNYACKAAGDIDSMIVINRTREEIRSPDARMNFTEIRTLLQQEGIPELEGRVVHVCCPWDKARTKHSLWSFDHNVDWYVFGPAGGWTSEIDEGLFVPQEGRGAMHATHIASTVLLHRYHTLQEGK